ncbi:hypothetical protein V492_03470 [Pseudogymnoascus sp. VKM F-4246]|nr:hypothetical protein V492_03470 [Pseudogymnoascus sp. VKM F-4246]
MTTRAMKNVEKAFTGHGKSLDENGDVIKPSGSKNIDRGFEKAGSPDSEHKDDGKVHPGRPQQERFGDQYRKPSLVGGLFYSNFSNVDHGTREHDKKR